MLDTSYPSATANAQVTIKMLAADSPEYSVPLMAAVTYGWMDECVDGWGHVKSLKIE